MEKLWVNSVSTENPALDSRFHQNKRRIAEGNKLALLEPEQNGHR